MIETIVKLVLGKLEALLSKEAELLLGVDDQIKSLRVKLLWIQSFLMDAEEKRRDNERIKAWVGLMRDIAYEAEDVIDMYSLRIELQRQQQCSFLAKSARSMKELPTLHTLGKKMENINARFQEIVACKSHFGIDEIHAEGPSTGHPRQQRLWRRNSRQEEVDTVGLDEAVQSLTRQLTDENELHRVVISIVGMGGSGKTTLVGRVYNSTDITNFFPSRLWISVSQNFREEDLLQGMAEGFMDMKKKDIVEMGVQQLIDTISKHLEEKKYLLVIDDIWSREAWKYIKRALPNSQNGSRVILTTRTESVARVDEGENIDIHEMKLLNDDQSWELFCKKALGEPSCPEGLMEVGRDIVAKCRNLPLAIVVMGGLLRRKDQTFTEWSRVFQRISIEFREGEDQTQRILGLSYDGLPHHLKPCFLYFALFPEDSKIWADDLIRMWIAEGFIPYKQNLTMEEVAEEYLEDLIDRSMVRLEYRAGLGVVVAVSIHDLLLDLALSEAKEMNFLCVYDKQKYSAQPSDSRRLAIHNHIKEYSSLNLSTPKLRSLLYTGRPPPRLDGNDIGCCTEFFTTAKHLPVGLFSCQLKEELSRAKSRMFQVVIQFPCHASKLLRVINLKDVILKSLPKEIGNMIQLRFLGLQFTELDKLPSSIGNLCNLQTLDICGTYIKSLPKAFWRIQSLRHVLLDSDYFRDKPKIVSELNDLQTLDGVVCGSWVGSGLVMMRNLRYLKISTISRANADALVIALKRLDRLVSLELSGHSLPVDVFTFSTHQHLQYLVLNGPLGQHLPDGQPLLPNLRRLFCMKTELEQKDIIILAKLPKLRHLFLDSMAYMGTQLVFPTQRFPKLETLHLLSLLKLEHLEVEEGGLPCVTEIKLFNCTNLKMLPKGMQHLTSLVTLYVNEMPTIASRIQKEGDEDYDKIKHVPSIVVS